MSRFTYVYDNVSGKMVLKGSRRTSVNCSASIMAAHKDFVSPIDGTLIASRRQLAEHNKKHGVTNSADYADGYITRVAAKKHKAGEDHLRKTRTEDLQRAFYQYR